MPEWLTADSIVKSWIFLTLAETLQRRLIKANPTTAKAAWEHVEKNFLDNKRTRTNGLNGELRVIHKIESIVTLLNDLGSPISDEDVVTYVMHGLSDKFAHIAGIIAHREPFPDLETMRSMVTTEEMRLNTKSQNSISNTTSSAPQVCRNFTRGFCKWGNTCKFIHDSSRASLAVHTSNNSNGNMRNVNSTAGSPSYNTGLQMSSNGIGNVGNLSSQQQALLARTLYGSMNAPQSSLPGQETILPQAFNTMTLQDPSNANWNMDTGASSHLNSDANNLSTILNSCIYPSVFIGDGKSIPVTNTGHSTLSTPYRTLHLNSVRFKKKTRSPRVLLCLA
ncbi:ribonuclease H-like domain-containing protein [Tanacetum coccineum]